MTCSEVRLHLSGLLEEDLDATLREQVSEHIESCDSCTELRIRLQRLTSALSRVVPEEPPYGIVSKIRERSQTPWYRVWSFGADIRIWRYAFGAGATAVLLIVAVSTHQPRTRVEVSSATSPTAAPSENLDQPRDEELARRPQSSQRLGYRSSESLIRMSSRHIVQIGRLETDDFENGVRSLTRFVESRGGRLISRYPAHEGVLVTVDLPANRLEELRDWLKPWGPVESSLTRSSDQELAVLIVERPRKK
jgi:hypothetical protein